jgi:hypothetical protein
MSTSKDITDRRQTIGRRITDRRNQPQTDAQRFASGENFTLFILRGVQTHIRNPRLNDFLNPKVADAIYNIAEGEIARIKHEQDCRKENKK